MPVLEILNKDEKGNAIVENGAQVNLIEDISINGSALSINDKKIDIPLASQADILALFEEEGE